MTGGTVGIPGASIAPPPGPRDIKILGEDGQPILTIHPDGRVIPNRPELADEAAHTFADYLTTVLQGRLSEIKEA